MIKNEMVVNFSKKDSDHATVMVGGGVSYFGDFVALTFKDIDKFDVVVGHDGERQPSKDDEEIDNLIPNLIMRFYKVESIDTVIKVLNDVKKDYVKTLQDKKDFDDKKPIVFSDKEIEITMGYNRTED